MKAKLIKTDKDNYTLFDEKGIPIGNTPNVISNNTFSKLSKQNCDEIFGVIDVEKLAGEITKEYATLTPKAFKRGVVLGFNKAMVLNKDKVFTFDDMKRAFKVGFSNGFASDIISQDKLSTEKENLFNEFIQSIQQPNEIEVEIKMYTKRRRRHLPERVPLLDSEECLILKRI
jgi:hypothetical protein